MDKSELLRSLSRIEFWRDWVFAPLVAIGILGEVILGLRYASRSKTLHNIEDGERNNLNLHIETLRNENLTLEAATSDRVFQDQGGAIERLSKYAETKVFIAYADTDPEAKSAAEQIAYVVWQAKWQLQPRSAIPKAGRVFSEGVNVLGKDNIVVSALIEELNKTNIIRPIAGFQYPHPLVASEGLTDEVLVQVGTKPDAFAAKRYLEASGRANRDPNFRYISGHTVNIPE